MLMRFFLCGSLIAAFLLSALAPAESARKSAPAASPSPTATPAPQAARTPGKSSFPPPVVVVYPLTVTGEADKESGSRLGLLFATRIATSGGITVKPPPPGTERKDFLDEARKLGADYYVSGYVTPIGNEVALVEQVVSTYSGIVMWSNTAQVLTYADASSQADIMRTAILRHAGRAVAQEDAPITQPTGATSPQPQGSGVNVGKLFSHKKSEPSATSSASAGTTVTAPPASRPTVATTSATTRVSATAAPTALPSPGKLVASATGSASVDLMHVTGNADQTSRAYAESALMKAFAASGFSAAVDSQHTLPETPARFKRVCERTKANAIAHSSVSFTGPTATMDLTVYDCAGELQYRGRAESKIADANVAIDRATAELLADYVRPVRKRKLTI